MSSFAAALDDTASQASTEQGSAATASGESSPHRLPPHYQARDGRSQEFCDALVRLFMPQSIVHFVNGEVQARTSDAGASRLLFKINGSSANSVKTVLKNAGFARIKSESASLNYNCLWGKCPPNEELAQMNIYQKVNHFPGTYNLGRKDSLARNLTKFRRRWGHENCDFVPRTFLLPADRDELAAYYSQVPSGTLFISKPNAAARGIGIKVLTDPTGIAKDKSCVVQHYIGNPLLINGCKFDMRIYVAVTCFDPLRVYVFEEGLGRFCCDQYNKKGTKNRYKHLTNYSLQKNKTGFVKNEDADRDDVGQKWSLRAVKAALASMGHDVEALWARIHDIIIKTLLAVEANINTNMQMHVPSRNNCFEVFGYDVLLDDTLKPWLMEVNSCPALACDAPIDKKIKHAMLTDLFNLCGFQQYDRDQFDTDVAAAKQARLLGRGSKGTSLVPPKLEIDTTKRREVCGGLRSALSNLNDDDLFVLREAELENLRAGRFHRIFPAKGTMHYNTMFEAKRYYNLLLGEYFESDHPPNILLGAAQATHRSGTIVPARPSVRSALVKPAPAPFASGSSWRPHSGHSPASIRPPAASRSHLTPLAALQLAGSVHGRDGSSGRVSPVHTHVRQVESQLVQLSTPPLPASLGRPNILVPLIVEASFSTGPYPKATRSVFDMRDSSTTAAESLADGLNVLHLVAVPRQASK
jgi:hypothetical protein